MINEVIVARGCEVCGANTNPRPLYSKGGCDVLVCNSCGTGRAVTSTFRPEHYYTKEYFQGGRTDGYADYEASEVALNKEFDRTLAFLTRFQPSGRLLEIGCAYGNFLRAAASKFEVYGIEISQHAVDRCLQYGLRVAQGTVSRESLAGIGTLDACVLLDVIEHLESPEHSLRMLTEKLKPGGHLLLTTGDFGSAFARASGRHWRLMTPPQHLWFFTQCGIRMLAKRLGLEVVAVDHPWKSVPIGLITYQVSRNFKSRLAAPTFLNHISIPVNLFDAMRVVLRRTSQ